MCFRASIRAGRLFPVNIDLESGPGIRAGLTAQVQFDLPTERALSVPLTAVVNPGGSQPYVFVYRDGTVLRKAVQLGRLVASRVVVRGPLAVGESVVVTVRLVIGSASLSAAPPLVWSP